MYMYVVGITMEELEKKRFPTGQRTKVVVFDCKAMPEIDFTIVQVTPYTHIIVFHTGSASFLTHVGIEKDM